ncbi:MAG: OmpA family protein [Spirochaetaceae bacterium]|jgi:outer membrane protein OmpA-like peptidoglycan-associated protein|nr:OmpA family protein [Spirochaetaceae bacterium]
MKSILLLLGIFTAAAQNPEHTDPAVLAMSETGPYSIVERSDWRRYNDGKYIGLVRHEVRASILPKRAEKSAAAPDALLYQGNFFVLQNTLRDMRQSAQAVDAVVPVSFQIKGNGGMVIENDQGFPALRGFPTFPAQKVVPGFKWRAPGNRAIDPLNTGKPVVIPFTADYEYKGVELYKGIAVHRIYATYASQYSGGQSYASVRGSHKVDILINAANGLPLFMRDTLVETYVLSDNSTVKLDGFTLTFGTGIVPLDRGAVIDALENTLGIPSKPPEPETAQEPAARPPLPTDALGDFQLEPVPEGVRLTVRDIRFAPDSDQFLPGETPKLDLIASALKQIPDRGFFVEGHTASTGNPGSEMELSIKRAKRMVDELISRGISADRFTYKGSGGTKPVGDNATNAGRIRNRRVEITILE